MSTPAPLTVTSEIATSLNDAGIGKVFHNKQLAESGPLGKAYDAWAREHGPVLLKKGGLVIVHGLGQRSEVILLARLFHLNGAGVRIKSLTGLVTTMRRGGEKMEEVDDAPMLVISPAVAGRRVCPLEPWDMDHVTEYLQARVDRGQIVLLHWETDRDLEETDPLYQWWDEAFMQWARKRATVLSKKDTTLNIKAEEE